MLFDYDSFSLFLAPKMMKMTQDRADLDFALVVPGGIDVVALSFVQKAADVQELKDIVQGRCRVSEGGVYNFRSVGIARATYNSRIMLAIKRSFLGAVLPHPDSSAQSPMFDYCALSGVLCGGVVWCGLVWCGVVWCGVVWCDVMGWGVRW